MSGPRRDAAFILLALMLAAGPAPGEDAKDKQDKQEKPTPQPPRVAFILPFAVAAGKTALVKIRGQNLTNVTEVRFTNTASPATLTLKSKEKVEVPKDAEAKKAGDAVVTVELLFPAASTVTTNWLVVTNPEGVSDPKPLLVVPEDALVEEKEPNGGWKAAQRIQIGQTVAGGIKEPGDVDVFRFSGKRGQRIELEVMASRWGSMLDSAVTLFDNAGHMLATADDGPEGADSVLSCTLPADGDYYASLIDAQDKGGTGYVYLLRLSERH